MSVLFEQATCADAWVEVSQHLLDNDPSANNVLVTITNPTFLDPTWLTRFNPREISLKGDHIRDVMNTVYPLKTRYNSLDRYSFYERYKKANRRSRKKRWGTYFGRLIAFGDKNKNQLEAVITALNKWRNPHAALTLHLSSPETDSLKPLGAPCWHYGEFLCPDPQTLELVAVYRNHDFFNKALGNYIGLSRLLNFICQETGRNPGRLVCHSVRAYYQSTKSELRRLVAR